MQNSRITLLMVLATIALIVGVALAGSVTNNYAESVTFGSMKRSVWDWTMETNGAIAGTIDTINGEIYRIVIPGGETNLYDLYLYDADTIDLLSGAGDALSSTDVHIWEAWTNLPIATAGTITLLVTNYAPVGAGTGQLIIYHR